VRDDLAVTLDPYDIKCLKRDEVKRLELVCGELQLFYKENKNMMKFIKSLTKLCSDACQQK